MLLIRCTSEPSRGSVLFSSGGSALGITAAAVTSFAGVPLLNSGGAIIEVSGTPPTEPAPVGPRSLAVPGAPTMFRQRSAPCTTRTQKVRESPTAGVSPASALPASVTTVQEALPSLRVCPDNVEAPTAAVAPQRSAAPSNPEKEFATSVDLGTVPGTCVVCLTYREDVLGAAWLHQQQSTESVLGEDETSCIVSACVSCLKTYFEGIVASGFDGACPRMRCMCCHRVVCEEAWSPLVDRGVLETFRKRAATLLSLQCSACHDRGSIMVFQPAQTSYRSLKESAMTDLAKTSPGDLRKIEAPGDDNANGMNEASCRPKNDDAFLLALDRYAFGDDVDVDKFYREVEAVVSVGLDAEGPQQLNETRYKRMVGLLSCVADSERRGSLHLRFLRCHPTVKTICCGKVHCFRCRIEEGHPGLTCEQYEAGQADVEVFSCPGCGVYVVKGDGCDDITCVCGFEFDWSDLVEERHEQVAEVFRIVFPRDPARAAAEIVRRGPVAENASAAVVPDEHRSPPDEQETSGGSEHRQEAPDYRLLVDCGIVSGPIDGETEEEGAGGGSAAAAPPTLVPGPTPGPMGELIHASAIEQGGASPQTREQVPALFQLEPGSLEEFRAASSYEHCFLEEVAQARATIFGKERWYFTAYQAIYLVGQDKNVSLDYFPRRYAATLPERSDTDRCWDVLAATDWLHHHKDEVDQERRRVSDALDYAVEAFYGSDSNANHAATAYVAARNARSALRYVRPPPNAGPLFHGIGYSEADADVPRDEEHGNHALQGNGEGGIVVSGSVTGGGAGPLLSPSRLPGPNYPSDVSRAVEIWPPSPETRTISTATSFEPLCRGSQVTAWVAHDSRNERLRRLMMREDFRLSKAWVALWGGHHPCLPFTAGIKVRQVDGKRETAAAARRCAYFEAYPEYLCLEQTPMMKSFVRRNLDAVETACAQIRAERATAWEAMHSTPRDIETGNEIMGTPGSRHSPFERAYAAYIDHTETNASISPECGKSSPGTNSTAKRLTPEERMLDVLASAWEAQNRSTVAAHRFAIAHRSSGEVAAFPGNVAAVAAVTAMVIVPMLTDKVPTTICKCKLDRVARDAAAWAALNPGEYERALEGMQACVEEGRRTLEGCECESEEGETCNQLMACPVVTRRILKVSHDACDCGDKLLNYDSDGNY